MCTCPSGLVLKDGFLCVNKSAVCQRRQFACLNGNCVLDMQVCDKENDCGDNSDESSALCGKLSYQLCWLILQKEVEPNNHHRELTLLVEA